MAGEAVAGTAVAVRAERTLEAGYPPRALEELLVHVHIPKTAGSALRRVLRANYSEAELMEPYRLASPTRDSWTELWESLPPERRERLRCVGAHTAHHLLAIVSDRPVRGFCMLRDPVERVASLHRAIQLRAQRAAAGSPGRAPRRFFDPIQISQALGERDWELRDLYRELGHRTDLPRGVTLQFARFFNGQARHLLAPYRDFWDLPISPSPEQLARHRALLSEVVSERYVIGAQDRYSQSIRLFSEAFGWRHAFVQRVNVARERAATPALDSETVALIREHNQLDVELHASFSERLSQLPPVGRTRDARAKLRLRVRARLGRPPR